MLRVECGSFFVPCQPLPEALSFLGPQKRVYSNAVADEKRWRDRASQVVGHERQYLSSFFVRSNCSFLLPDSIEASLWRCNDKLQDKKEKQMSVAEMSVLVFLAGSHVV